MLYLEKFQTDRLVKELKGIYRELVQEYSSQMAYTYLINYIIHRIAQDTGVSINYEMPYILAKKCIMEEIEKTLEKSRYDFNIAVNNNLLGKVYEDFLDIETRKNLGLFYTPIDIVSFIINKSLEKVDVLQNPFVKILDPACGSGYFLINAYDILKDRFSKNINELKDKYAEESYKVIKHGEITIVKGKEYWQDENIHYHIIKNCIYGADVDEFGVLFAVNSLKFKQINGNNYEPNIVVCNSLIKWEKQSGTKLSDFWSNNFDFILGNPPWVSLSRKYGKKITEGETLYYKENYSGNSYLPNLYEYFLERSLEIIKKGGTVGFLIPDRFAKNSQFIRFRKRILTDFNIKCILFKVKLHDLTVDSMALIIENCFNEDNKVEIKNMDNHDFYVEQSDFLKLKYFEFASFNFYNYKNMLEKLEQNTIPLGEIAVTFTGFIGIKKNITENLISNNQVPILKGENIIKYKVRGNKFYELSSSSIIGGTKNMDKLKKKDKLLVRKTGKKIIAALDTEGWAVEQSLYGIIVTNKEFSSKYLIAILNSKLMEWYYTNFLVTNVDSTPQLKKMNLDEIPIKYCSLERQKYVEDLVDKINNEFSLNAEELQKSIDEEIFDIYNISPEEIET